MTGWKVYVSDYDYEDLSIEESVLSPIGAQVIGLHDPTGEHLASLAVDADVLMCRYARVTRETIEALPRCRAICRYGIGVDSVDIEAVYDNGMVLTNIPDFCTDEVAENTIAMAFSLLRQLPRYDRAVHAGSWRWQDAGVPVMRFRDITFGLLGFGRIAQNVARKIHAFGFRIVGYDPYVAEATMMSHGVEKVAKDELLEQSDLVAVLCPYTPATHHVIDEQALRRMKRTASLVNCARGKLVDTAALATALEAGWIAGAGLDDLEEEPSKHPDWTPEATPLLANPNCIVTPHSAYYSERSMELNRRMTAQNARAVLLGERPINVVRPQEAPR